MRSLFDHRHSQLFFTGQGFANQSYATDAELLHARQRWVLSWYYATAVQDSDIGGIETPMLYHAYKWGSPPRNLSANATPPVPFAQRLMLSNGAGTSAHEHHHRDGLHGHSHKGNHTGTADTRRYLTALMTQSDSSK